MHGSLEWDVGCLCQHTKLGIWGCNFNNLSVPVAGCLSAARKMTGESDALVTHGHGHKILLFHNKKKAFTNHSISSSLKFYSFTTGKLCLLYRTSRGPSASKMLNIMPYTRRCSLLINRLWIVSPRPTGPVFSPWVCHWSIALSLK